ncbi:hypothetical protein AAFF_G00110990 [Aldrovandia affinis]|uniref:Uncharacterized protein n=1 Tax=Aldrovandia affinis TaxID=143900 RepID=A0AAD7RTU4_9TELE|nr:hypothetical protein AAFF_G00110990 [Aldrovandia affinis]
MCVPHKKPSYPSFNLSAHWYTPELRLLKTMGRSCNAVLSTIPTKILNSLQLVQNSAARTATHLHSHGHTTADLRLLHPAHFSPRLLALLITHHVCLY